MAIYAVGDLQGCLTPLERLLEQVRFDPARDRLWLVGDLVNRGPDSGACLRRIRDLGTAAVTVLGNHDLHLLAAAAGIRAPQPRDTLAQVLDRPDAAELLDWLAACPLIHHDQALDWTLVHAGIPPAWDLGRARTEAAAVSAVLQEPTRRKAFLAQMYGDHPDAWEDTLEGPDRLRYTVNALTRMRFLRADGRLDFSDSGPPEQAAQGLTPWFAVPERAMAGHSIVFGHWSALGFRRGPDWLALDSGCVWGNSLTLVRLDAAADEITAWQQPCG